MKQITRVLLLSAAAAAAFAFSPAQAADLSAREIMQRVDDRDDGDNGTSDLEMILIDKNGKKRVRKVRNYSKDKGEDRRQIMFFLEPADVKDTAFLTYDYDAYEADDDQWLYLPALHKTKRIATADKSGSFMGSDFNYSDMTRRNLDAYDYKIVKQMKVHGHDTWLIEAKPRSNEEIEETGYKKSLLFVRKDNFVPVRAVHWVDGGGELKYMDVPRLEKIDGIWVATEMTMTTKKGKVTKHKTILRFHNVRFNQELSEEMFTLRRLEQGL